MIRSVLSILAAGICLGTAVPEQRPQDDGGGGPYYDFPGAHYDSKSAVDAPPPEPSGLLFHAPLNSNGVTGYTDLPPGFPVPDFAWMGWAPTLDNTGNAGSLAENGDPTEVGSPFCPGGNFAVDSTPGFSGNPNGTSLCSSAQRLDGTGDSYGPVDAVDYSGGVSVCVVARMQPDSGANRTLISRMDATTGDGWAMYVTPAGLLAFELETTTSSVTTTNNGLFATKLWGMYCAVVDEADRTRVYINSFETGSTAFQGGTASTTTGLFIGEAVGYSNSKSDIQAAWVWNGTPLTAAQVTTFGHHYMGLTEVINDDVINSGTAIAPSACWVDGKLEEFAFRWLKIGCSTADTSGSGMPTGYLVNETLTTNIIHSGDLSGSSWTENGVGVVNCGETTDPGLYRDDRTVCRLRDDDAGTSEYIHTSLSSSGFTAGQNMTLCLAARNNPGHNSDLDVLIQEGAGTGSGFCTPQDHNFLQVTTSSTWTMYGFTAVWGDSDCYGITVQISPSEDISDVTNDDHDAFVSAVALYYDQSSGVCPIGVPNTTNGFGQTMGDDTLEYAMTVPVVNSSGEFEDVTAIEVTTMYAYNAIKSSGRILKPETGTGSDFHLLEQSASNTGQWTSAGGILNTSGVQTVAVGTEYTWKMVTDYGTSLFELFRNGLSIDTDTTATAENTLDTIYVGVSRVGTLQSEEGVYISDVKVRRAP